MHQIMGIIPPMTTPFDKDEDIDTDAFRQDVNYLINAGVQGLAVGGSTGEGLVMAAVDDLLYPCFALGCDGSIAAILTAVPELCVSLWDAVSQGKHDDALNLHKRLLRVWNAIAGANLPACVKYAMQLKGRNAGRTRSPMPEASDAQKSAIRAALQEAEVI